MALREIVALVDDTSDQVARIATASEEQSASSEEINRAVAEISRISEEIASGMHDSATAVEHLVELSRKLEDLIGAFQSEGEGGARSRAS